MRRLDKLNINLISVIIKSNLQLDVNTSETLFSSFFRANAKFLENIITKLSLEVISLAFSDSVKKNFHTSYFVKQKQKKAVLRSSS